MEISLFSLLVGHHPWKLVIELQKASIFLFKWTSKSWMSEPNWSISCVSTTLPSISWVVMYVRTSWIYSWLVLLEMHSGFWSLTPFKKSLYILRISWYVGLYSVDLGHLKIAFHKILYLLHLTCIFTFFVSIYIPTVYQCIQLVYPFVLSLFGAEKWISSSVLHMHIFRPFYTPPAWMTQRRRDTRASMARVGNAQKGIHCGFRGGSYNKMR